MPESRDNQPAQPSKASLTFAARQTFVRPMQRAITALINDYHQAVANRDAGEQAELRRRILTQLEEFDATAGDGHAYPDWVRPVMRANALAAFGELDEAIRWETRGAAAAEIDMHKAISANNLSDHFRRLGDHAQAIACAREAYQLWPENDGIIVNLALALYKAGQKTAAGAILTRLAAVSPPGDDRSILDAHLRFEEELREMHDLPEVRELLSRAGAEPKQP
ncbi:MAG: tetratricopeptide repeat protein [Phycisphaerales bacterium]|nr:tetratricopeptide repeat protein [Phycisphaerales bacterium]